MCSIDGEGMVNFAVPLVIDLRNLNGSTITGCERRTLPVTLRTGTASSAPWNAAGPGIDHCLDALEALEEIDVPPIAPELPIGDRGQAHRLLLCHRVADAAVLDVAQRLAADLARLRGGAGPLKLGRAQQAADLVGPERGFRLERHG